MPWRWRGGGWAGARELRRAVWSLPQHRRCGRGQPRCRDTAARRFRDGTPPAVGMGLVRHLASSPFLQ
jgi:hypothetical protein